MAEKSKYQIKTRSQMKEVKVIFVSEDLIGSVISSRKEYERLIRQKSKAENDKLNDKVTGNKLEDGESIVETKPRKRKHNDEINEVNAKKSKYIDDVELALAALENDDVEKMEINEPTTLFDDQEDVSAKKIYNFENKNHNQKTPKSCLKSPATPKNKLNIRFSNKENDTPKNKNRLEKIDEEPSATPYSLRRKVIKDIKKIQKILENSDDDFSASESEYSAEGESSSQESGDEDGEKKSSKTKIANFNYKISSANFFESQSVKKSITSNNSLRKLKNPKLTQEKLDEIFRNCEVNPEHRNCVKKLFNQSVSLFEKWDFVLEQNFNIVLYGVGSKKEIINKFVQRFLNKHPVIVVNGFFPSVTVKEIIDKVCQILNIEPDSNDIIEKIQNKISDYDIKIYLAINNIEGIMLRNKKAQMILSQLGKIEQIPVIATIDHINAPLIWDNCTYSDFNWVWYDCTTFMNYQDEIVYEGNIMLQSSGQLTLSSLRNVFNSLTKNSREIFLMILKNQLDAENKKAGISFRELYQECRKELLISSDVALRSQLKEFLDHMILKQKRTADGEERFVIAIESNILKQFLDEQERS